MIPVAAAATFKQSNSYFFEFFIRYYTQQLMLYAIFYLYVKLFEIKIQLFGNSTSANSE